MCVLSFPEIQTALQVIWFLYRIIAKTMVVKYLPTQRSHLSFGIKQKKNQFSTSHFGFLKFPLSKTNLSTFSPEKYPLLHLMVAQSCSMQMTTENWKQEWNNERKQNIKQRDTSRKLKCRMNNWISYYNINAICWRCTFTWYTTHEWWTPLLFYDGRECWLPLFFNIFPFPVRFTFLIIVKFLWDNDFIEMSAIWSSFCYGLPSGFLRRAGLLKVK